MKVRMLMDVNGTFHDIEGGVRIGDVVDVDNDSGENYIKLGYAEKASTKSSSADDSALLQVATRSSEYVTAEESEKKEVKAMVDEAAAVNTPDPKEDAPDPRTVRAPAEEITAVASGGGAPVGAAPSGSASKPASGPTPASASAKGSSSAKK